MVVDPPESNRRLHRELRLPFPVLSDAGFQLLDPLRLRHPRGHGGRDIAWSAGILTDPSGTVRRLFLGRTVQERARPEVVLAAARRALDRGRQG